MKRGKTKRGKSNLRKKKISSTEKRFILNRYFLLLFVLGLALVAFFVYIFNSNFFDRLVLEEIEFEYDSVFLVDSNSVFYDGDYLNVSFFVDSDEVESIFFIFGNSTDEYSYTVPLTSKNFSVSIFVRDFVFPITFLKAFPVYFEKRDNSNDRVSSGGGGSVSSGGSGGGGSGSPGSSNPVEPEPLVIVNYFLTRSGEGEVIGDPIIFNSSNLNSSTGNDVDEVRVAFSSEHSPGFVSLGPYMSIVELNTELNSLNPGIAANKFFFVSFEMKTDNINFSENEIGYLEITARNTSTLNERILRERKIYPQDFFQTDTFQNFSFSFPHYFNTAAYKGDATEEIQFKFYWNGTSNVTLRKIYVTPWAFEPVFGGFSTASWNFDANGDIIKEATHRKMFDPNWILTYKTNIDGTISPLDEIEPWRRDIVVGREGNYPYIGTYTQRNAEVLRYNIRQAKAAGIDAFAVPDFVLPSQTGNSLWSSFSTLLDVAEEEDFKVMIDNSLLSTTGASAYLSSTTYPAQYNYTKIYSEFESLVAKEYFNHSAYLRIDGRPVYFVPLVYETNVSKVTDFVSTLNETYKSSSGDESGIYIMMTAFSTFSQVPIKGNYTIGPYNTQSKFFRADLDLTHAETLYPDWEDSFVCDVPPVKEIDLLNCRCRYGDYNASGYCVLLSTLVNNSNMNDYASTGVDTYFDWAPTGIHIWPSSISVDSNSNYTIIPSEGEHLSLSAFELILEDAHSFGMHATISIEPSHDKRNYYVSDLGSSVIPILDDDGVTPRWERMVRDAFSARDLNGARADIIWIENWNGYGESVNIEPAVDTRNSQGITDPNFNLKILASAKGITYVPPCIPSEIVDSFRLPYIPSSELCS